MLSIAFGVSLGRPRKHGLNILDVPDARKLHGQAAPLIGGDLHSRRARDRAAGQRHPDRGGGCDFECGHDPFVTGVLDELARAFSR